LGTKRTRRKFLKGVGAGAGALMLAGILGCEPARRRSVRSASARANRKVWSFRSRSGLVPPAVGVTTAAHDTSSGYVFVAPKRGVLAPQKGPGQNGLMILDDGGQLVWFYSLQDQGKSATDFKVQSYRGRPVLTWWEAAEAHGPRVSEYVILDDSYGEVKRVRAGDGYEGDMHEFLITPEDTALIPIYGQVPTDLSSFGGPKDGFIVEGVIQEVDIETGEVLFEWHSLDHVGPDESYYELTSKGFYYKNFEYFHLNSIDIDDDGNLLISAKKTFALYKLDRKTGDIIWRLGGKKSDFQMGPGTRTRRQHDARRLPDGTITVFDNRGDPKDYADGVAENEQSRGVVLEVDEEKMTVSLVRQYTHPDKMGSVHEGNMQALPNGNVFIGWGSEPVFSEFSKVGELLFDADFVNKQQSYRAFCFPWVGQPQEDPVAVAERTSGDEVKVYSSWNGATEVATWEILSGERQDELKTLKSFPRDGFETAMSVRTSDPYVAVRAKDRSGRVLGTTKPVEPRS
jgi:outer membrane protein assembly factor BamB